MEQQSHLSDLTIDSIGAQHLRGFTSWAKFLSIIGFIICGIIAIFAFFAGTIIASLSPNTDMAPVTAGLGVMLTVIYLILAAVYFIPTLFLFQSATKLRDAIASTDQDLLNAGLGKLKASFQFWGILTIIIIGFYLLIILLAALGAAMS